jgi:hypothetical protein
MIRAESEVPMFVDWPALFAPALLATVLVFVASSLIHMVIRWHEPDYGKLANEDEVRAVLRKGAPAPGQYVVPHCLDSKEMAGPAMQQKFVEGPNALLWVRPNGNAKLGGLLGAWIVYVLVLSLLVGYVGASALPRGAEYLKVFQVVGAVAWLAYAWGGPIDSIWKGRPWLSTFRGFVDGLVYAALTAGAFAWLWPR